jgi:hypothetical protein
LIYHWQICFCVFARIVIVKLHNFILYFQGHESSQTQKSTKGQKLNNTAASRKGLSTYSHLTSDGIWSSIKEFAKSKYQVFHFFQVLKLFYFKNTLMALVFISLVRSARWCKAFSQKGICSPQSLPKG